jgi:N-acetylgalactosamine kinase
MAANNDNLTMLLSTFQKRFNEKAQHVVRAPGRVNLIGEHIDYSGYSVLPIAIEADVHIALSKSHHIDDKMTVHIENMCAEKWPGASYSSFDESLDRNKRHWTHYVLAGCRGVLEYCRQNNIACAPLNSLKLLVNGRVPCGSGLSSSSALVCAAALAFNCAFDLAIDSTQLADVCARAERYVGAESGGMDQAISFLADKGVAKLISFDPLRAESVRLPDDATFVLINSGVEHSVADGGGYNMRVSECRLAAALLAAKLGVDGAAVRRLDDVQRLVEPPASLERMAELAGEHLPSAACTLDELLPLLGDAFGSIDALRARCVSPAIDVATCKFKLRDRAVHVYAEAARVHRFRALCDDDDVNVDGEQRLAALGALMSDSHESCRALFECSCAQLDATVASARQAGALGSRLTGAGWGGWTVSLVSASSRDAFLAAQHSDRCIDTKPAAGASILF